MHSHISERVKTLVFRFHALQSVVRANLRPLGSAPRNAPITDCKKTMKIRSRRGAKHENKTNIASYSVKSQIATLWLRCSYPGYGSERQRLQQEERSPRRWRFLRAVWAGLDGACPGCIPLPPGNWALPASFYLPIIPQLPAGAPRALTTEAVAGRGEVMRRRAMSKKLTEIC